MSLASGSGGAPSSSSAPAPSSSSSSSSSAASVVEYRRWQPLPKILYGFAVSPFAPELESLELPPPEALGDNVDGVLGSIQSQLIGLEVGDEVYVFEQLGYTEVSWLRGYVVSTTRVPSVLPGGGAKSDYSSLQSSQGNGMTEASLVEEPQVYVGIFPAAHVHVKEHLDDAEMRLAEIYALAKEQNMVGPNALPPGAKPLLGHKSHMETLPEEDETAPSAPGSPHVGGQAGGSERGSTGAGAAAAAAGGGAGSGKVTFNGNRQSFVLNDAQEDTERPPPPLPSLKCGDETFSGASEPLVDEIACALREWSSLMYTYLGRRDYALFHTVKDHIDVLHTARRQLLAQTLSSEEVSKLRRECVARLVKGNVAQGLDVIVRHPGRGGLVDVDFTGKESDPESWVSGIRLYALQASLAYVDQQHFTASGGNAIDLATSNAFGITVPTTTRAGVLGSSSSVFSGLQQGKRNPRASIMPRRARSATVDSATRTSHGVKYFHVYLDVRAFVASPCQPGETAELYFSLYNKAESRFLTEEFCVVLNHQGVPAFDSEGRLGKIRTLFTDLSASDMSDLNVVCRIVRNGAMRLSGAGGSAVVPAGTLSPGPESSSSSRYHEALDPALAGTAGFRSKRMTSDRTFRRPFGCAVLELGQEHQFQTDVTSSSPMKEHAMPIFLPVNEAAFSTLHQDIIASRIKEFEKSPRAELVAVNIKVLHGETATLVRENPSLLQDIPLTARLGFPDVVFPGDRRNEAYIKLWSGEFFPQSGKMPGGGTPKNIQVSVEIRRRDGRVLENVISRGAGEQALTQFDSTVFYHQNAPTWGELLKIQIPERTMEDCHLFFSFRHRSSKEEKAGSVGGGAAGQGVPSVPQGTINPPFAHAYLPLFEANSAFIPDGSHTLLLWRSSRPSQNLSPELYFSLPTTVPPGKAINDLVPASMTTVIQPLRDTFTLRSFLVSTRYTQNEVLLKLLNWEKYMTADIEELKSVLVKCTFVGEVEIVKFLRDIFDALFAIVVAPRNGSGELDDLVFNALVHVLGIIQDRRFNNFRATLDIYIDEHFHSQTAYTRLMASMSRLLADPGRTNTSKDLRAAIKVWPYLFKFMVRSRENQRGERGGQNGLGGAVSDHFETSFKRDLEALLRSINRLMSATKPASIVGTQVLALQHFAGILPDLARVFPLEELVRIETAFADSIFITKGRMVVWKLLHVLHVVHDGLFEDPASRSQLIPSIVRWIRPHLGAYDENSHSAPDDLASAKDSARIAWIEGARLGVTVIAVVLDRLQTNLVRGRNGELTPHELRQEQDNVDYLLSMLPKLLETYKELDSPAMIRSIERHRSPSTLASSVPVIFPSSYPFPLIAKKPAGNPSPISMRSSRRKARKADRLNFLNCGLGEIAAVLTVLIMLSPRRHLASFLDEQLDLDGVEALSKFLFDFYKVATSILINEAFPSTWLNINILTHQMVLKMADPLAALMVRDFIPQADRSDEFNVPLWRACLSMLLTLLSSEQLVIEQFKPQRRRAVWRLAGDIRGDGAQIFAKLWNSIGWPDRPVNAASTEIVEPGVLNTGGFQVSFSKSLVEPVLELAISHHDELRTCAVKVLAGMITSEWHLHGDFSAIEANLIDRLNVLFVTDTQGDEISRAFFIGQLRSLFDSPGIDEALREQVHRCLVSVNRFLDLLLSVRSLPAEEGFEDDRVAGTLKLLGFLRQANRVTAFSTHVLRLVNLHLENHNYVEAALTLKLHADLHSWDMNSFVEPITDLDLPRQSHFARKETLYFLILDYLGKGEAWEISVDICRELAHQYEYLAVDYVRLAEVLKHQASLFEKIATVERTYPSYFRVAYYGEQWPASLQGKMFVYRGLNWEKFAAFCERLHQKHPNATLIKSNSNPSDEIRYGDGMFLQITAVQPEPDRSKDVFTNSEVPPNVRAYFEHNTTSLFSFTRPLVKDAGGGGGGERPTSQGSATEFSQLWVEKTLLRCEDAFPTVLRRSEVAEIEMMEISPLENALNDVKSKREELETLEKRYSALAKVGRSSLNAQINTNRLSMALNAAVDSPVNGGIPMYKRTFFSSLFVGGNPDKEALIGELRDGIDAYAAVISRCIKLHARLCPPEMRPFHETLERFFAQNYAEEVQRLGIDVEATEDGGGGGGAAAGSGGGGRGATAIGAAAPRGSAETAVPTSFGAALDEMGRLQLDPSWPVSSSNGGVGTGGELSVGGGFNPAIQSPLQKHINYLSRQAQPITASPTQFDGAANASGGASSIFAADGRGEASSTTTALRIVDHSGIGGMPQSASIGALSSGSGGGGGLAGLLASTDTASTYRQGGGAASRYESSLLGGEGAGGGSVRQPSIFSKMTESSSNRFSKLIKGRRN